MVSDTRMSPHRLKLPSGLNSTAMAVFCVSYDLNKSGQNYEGLIEELKKSSSWARPTASTWLVYTSEDASQLYNRLAPYLDKNDLILVIEVTRDHAGWLHQDIWNWINQYLPKAASAFRY